MSKHCYLCGSKKFTERNGRTRDRVGLKVVQCQKCRLTTLASFAHYKSISYECGDMREKVVATKAEYKKVLAIHKADDTRRMTQWKNLIKNKTLLDFGSGAGGFLKYAAKITKKVFAVELDNITKFYPKSIEVKRRIEEFALRFDVITLFHVVEHIPDPISLLKNLKKYLKPNGIIIIEVPNDDDALINYYQLQSFKDFTYWGLHLYSYNKKTLREICRRAGFKSIKIELFQRYPFSNHIGWLKDGQPGGHDGYNAFNNERLNEQYIEQLKKIDGCDTLVAVLKP